MVGLVREPRKWRNSTIPPFTFNRSYTSYRCLFSEAFLKQFFGSTTDSSDFLIQRLLLIQKELPSLKLTKTSPLNIGRRKLPQQDAVKIVFQSHQLSLASFQGKNDSNLGSWCGWVTWNSSVFWPSSTCKRARQILGMGEPYLVTSLWRGDFFRICSEPPQMTWNLPWKSNWILYDKLKGLMFWKIFDDHVLCQFWEIPWVLRVPGFRLNWRAVVFFLVFLLLNCVLYGSSVTTKRKKRWESVLFLGDISGNSSFKLVTFSRLGAFKYFIFSPLLGVSWSNLTTSCVRHVTAPGLLPSLSRNLPL